MKMKIGVPTYNKMMLTETSDMLAKICEAYDLVAPDITAGGNSIAINRNRLLTSSGKKKQVFDFDYFLAVDADVYVDDPVSVVNDLLAFDVPICTAVYPYRVPGYEHMYVAGNFKDNNLLIADFLNDSIDSPISCDFGCLGFALIHKSIFEQLEYPYFHESVVDYGDCASIISEDITFFWKLKSIGIKCLVDCSNVLNHKSIGG